MRTFTTARVAALGLLGGAALASFPAAAAITTYSFNAGGCATNNTNYDNQRACSSGVTATGWSNTGYPNTSGSELDRARIVMYSGGIGITNKDGPGGPGGGTDANEADSDAPEHGIDNDQRKDMVMLTFTSAVKLTDVQIGYRFGDSDMTVLAFTGGTCGGTGILGKTYSGATGLLACGWTLVSHIANVPQQSGTNFTSINNTSGITSQYWLVGTYVSDLANASKTVGSIESTTVKDHIKLLAVRGDPNGKVPEPGTLGLLGLAGFGLWRLRRKA